MDRWMVSRSSVNGRKSRAIKQITDPPGIDERNGGEEEEEEEEQKEKKRQKEEVWMESGGTGTVTSVVLRDDGLMHYVALTMQRHYSSAPLPWLYGVL